MTANCIACGSDSTWHWFTKTNDAGDFPVHRCSTCGSGLIWPRPSDDFISGFYALNSYKNHDALSASDMYSRIVREEAEFPNSTVDARRISENCRSMTAGRNFLDVGAGFGFFSKSAQDAGFQVAALEPSPASRAVLRLMIGIDAQPSMLDSDYANAHPEQFDVVLLSQVLEHIIDPKQTAQLIHKLLKPGGVCCIALPHFRSWMSILLGRRDPFICPPEHLNFFSMRGLITLFESSGFSTVRAHTVSRFDPRRIEKRLGVPVIKTLGAMLLSWFLKLSDKMGKGMMLNMYFRKL